MVCVFIIINVYVTMYIHSCIYVYVKSWIVRLSHSRDYLYLMVKETLSCNVIFQKSKNWSPGMSGFDPVTLSPI